MADSNFIRTTTVAQSPPLTMTTMSSTGMMRICRATNGCVIKKHTADLQDTEEEDEGEDGDHPDIHIADAIDDMGDPPVPWNVGDPCSCR